jgi:putative membrane protein
MTATKRRARGLNEWACEISSGARRSGESRASDASSVGVETVQLVISFLLNALALWIVTLIYSGVHADSTTAVLIAALVFGVVNALVRPLMLLFSLPFIVLTLGLFIFVVNGLTFWLTGALVPGFHVDGLWAGIVGSVLLGLVSWAISAVGLRPRAEA